LERVQVADVKWPSKLEHGEDLGLCRLAIGSAVIHSRDGDDQREFRADQCNEGEDDEDDARIAPTARFPHIGRFGGARPHCVQHSGTARSINNTLICLTK
jgi:hypothetical protein